MPCFMKYIIKNSAFSAGKSATFMPKLLFGEAGIGLHVYFLKDGSPLFYAENGYSVLSKMGLFFIGGILKHIKALCAITNPSTNSYKRLVEGYEAPVNICFLNYSIFLKLLNFFFSITKIFFQNIIIMLT